MKPFGSYLADLYGDRVFMLGFAAQGGTTRGRPEPRIIEAAAPGSLETFTGPIARDGAILLDAAALSKAGTRSGGLFSYLPIVEDWSQLFDGVVIFDRQVAAGDIRTGNTPK
ncbi:erythromycin esterase family protein [Altererythrobacter sp. BO-6]|uniref:erythromycin esterase family protein n=1 Tax=Altererythrobacter sp. BO-6 TaxID=2604537 RepID=UPI0013E144D3|nr:erythromycin esterase family protein [Altererythrobacter sp. BO-6]QIG53666.1 erythromycin esterase family protein [Altererythrobacter sp. BO-6]